MDDKNIHYPPRKRLIASEVPARSAHQRAAFIGDKYVLWGCPSVLKVYYFSLNCLHSMVLSDS